MTKSQAEYEIPYQAKGKALGIGNQLHLPGDGEFFLSKSYIDREPSTESTTLYMVLDKNERAIKSIASLPSSFDFSPSHNGAHLWKAIHVDQGWLGERAVTLISHESALMITRKIGQIESFIITLKGKFVPSGFAPSDYYTRIGSYHFRGLGLAKLSTRVKASCVPGMITHVSDRGDLITKATDRTLRGVNLFSLKLHEIDECIRLVRDAGFDQDIQRNLKRFNGLVINT